MENHFVQKRKHLIYSEQNNTSPTELDEFDCKYIEIIVDRTIFCFDKHSHMIAVLFT